MLSQIETNQNVEFMQVGGKKRGRKSTKGRKGTKKGRKSTKGRKGTKKHRRSRKH